MDQGLLRFCDAVDNGYCGVEFGCLILEILQKVFKEGTLIAPNDITEWEIEAKREARIQKRERNRIINDIADAVRKRL